jgi:hypothetical protein
MQMRGRAHGDLGWLRGSTRRRKKVIFFLEPAVYRNNPLMLRPWLEFVESIAKNSRQDFDSYLVGSLPIVSLASDIFAGVYTLDGSDILRWCGFDRTAYSRDLCDGEAPRNLPLLVALKRVNAEFEPDFVVSWSENKYLRHAFVNAKVMFMELGPLPRYGLKMTAFLDPLGHQTACSFQRASNSAIAPSNIPEIESYWRRRWIQRVTEKGLSDGIADWLNGLDMPRKERLLVVLQPSDWLTYEGVGPNIDPISLLRRIAIEEGNKRTIIPQWHPADPPPAEDLLKEIAHHHPNIRIPPAALRANHSDMFLPFVDGVVTISSNVAVMAAVLGKRVRVLGRSKVRALDTGTQQPSPRFDVLAFLLRRYCRPLDEWMTTPGAFANHLFSVAEHPDLLFDLKSEVDVGKFDSFFVESA